MLSSLRFSILVVCVLGCQTFREPKFNRPHGAGDGPLVAIPFREPARNLWYGESERGELLIGGFVAWARSNAKPDFAEGKQIDELQRVVRDWQGEEIGLEDWVKLAAPLGVKYVLVGQIERLSLSSPMTVGILDATIVVSYKVFDVSAKRTVWERKNYTISLAKKGELDTPMLELGADKKRLEEDLLVKAGSEIGKDLYGYTAGSGYNEDN